MRVAWTIGNQLYFNGSDKVTSVSFISISRDNHLDFSTVWRHAVLVFP
jgi:hypothetical protein